MSNTQDMSQISTAQLLVHGMDMGAAAELLRSVGAAGGQALARQYHLDRQGGVQATSVAGATMESDYGVDAWGNVLAGSALDNPLVSLGGLGYWQEPDLGLSYVRARWLDSKTGSWMSVDPVTSEPRYSYAHNRPTIRTDATGTQDQNFNHDSLARRVKAHDSSLTYWELVEADSFLSSDEYHLWISDIQQNAWQRFLSDPNKEKIYAEYNLNLSIKLQARTKLLGTYLRAKNLGYRVELDINGDPIIPLWLKQKVDSGIPATPATTPIMGREIIGNAQNNDARFSINDQQAISDLLGLESSSTDKITVSIFEGAFAASKQSAQPVTIPLTDAEILTLLGLAGLVKGAAPVLGGAMVLAAAGEASPVVAVGTIVIGTTLFIVSFGTSLYNRVMYSRNPSWLIDTLFSVSDTLGATGLIESLSGVESYQGNPLSLVQRTIRGSTSAGSLIGMGASSLLGIGPKGKSTSPQPNVPDLRLGPDGKLKPILFGQVRASPSFSSGERNPDVPRQIRLQLLKTIARKIRNNELSPSLIQLKVFPYNHKVYGDVLVSANTRGLAVLTMAGREIKLKQVSLIKGFNINNAEDDLVTRLGEPPISGIFKGQPFQGEKLPSPSVPITETRYLQEWLNRKNTDQSWIVDVVAIPLDKIDKK